MKINKYVVLSLVVLVIIALSVGVAFYNPPSNTKKSGLILDFFCKSQINNRDIYWGGAKKDGSGGVCELSGKYKSCTNYCENSNSCRNLSTDISNCGSCGKKCDVGLSCLDGICSENPLHIQITVPRQTEINFVLPFVLDGKVDRLDWGDGTDIIDKPENYQLGKQYQRALYSRTYDIRVYGTNFTNKFEPRNGSGLITKIISFGNNSFVSISFKQMSNLISIPEKLTDYYKKDIASIDMSHMFQTCQLFNQNINNWDVSKVTNMSFMFFDCVSFNKPLDMWNVSNVSDMTQMFFNCLSFNQDLSKWATKINSIQPDNIFALCPYITPEVLKKWGITF